MKARYIIMLSVAVLLLSSGPAQAQGYCFNTPTFCNDYYFELGPGVGAQLIVGYEYGCGFKDRPITGAVRMSGGTAYLSILAAYGASSVSVGIPAGLNKSVTAAVSLATGVAPTGYYQYWYANGTGGVASISGTTSFAAISCAPPAGPQPGKPMKPDMFDPQR